MRGNDLKSAPGLERSREEFLTNWRDVPPELLENCKHQNRGRRAHELDLLPQSRCLVPRLPTEIGFFEYAVPAKLNPEHTAARRKFHPLTEKQLHNDFFRELVLWQFDQLPLTAGERKRPFEVGAHLIDYRPRAGIPSVPTPNRPHRDGEPWLMIVLVHRQGVSGGINTIHDDGGNELFRVTLTDPLDLLLLNDEMVKHHVREIGAEPFGTESSRIVLVVDLTPLGKIRSWRN